MNKQFLLTVATFIALGGAAFAQCTPDPNNTSDLIYPSPDNANYTLVENQPFDDRVTINLPVDSSAGPVDAFIDSLKINSVQGLPPGLASECNNVECLILGGQQGCVRLFGTPTQADTYTVTINATMFLRIKLTNTPLTWPIEEEYDMVVDKETNVRFIQKDKNISLYPNPAKNTVFVELRDYVGEYSVQIFNIMGVEVLNKKLAQTRAEIATDMLSSGMYIVKVITPNTESSTRLLISK